MSTYISLRILFLGRDGWNGKMMKELFSLLKSQITLVLAFTIETNCYLFSILLSLLSLAAMATRPYTRVSMEINTRNRRIQLLIFVSGTLRSLIVRSIQFLANTIITHWTYLYFILGFPLCQLSFLVLFNFYAFYVWFSAFQMFWFTIPAKTKRYK